MINIDNEQQVSNKYCMCNWNELFRDSVGVFGLAQGTGRYLSLDWRNLSWHKRQDMSSLAGGPITEGNKERLTKSLPNKRKTKWQLRLWRYKYTVIMGGGGWNEKCRSKSKLDFPGSADNKILCWSNVRTFIFYCTTLSHWTLLRVIPVLPITSSQFLRSVLQ
jgi:hypothetical protein